LSRNPDGKVFTGSFQLCGQNFAAINGGPMFQLNPSVSFYVACETAEEVDTLWGKISEGGSEMMALGTYPWSERYGWLKDRFGMTWQITVDKTLAEVQKITPSLLFAQEVHGRGNEAVDFYTSVFSDASIVMKALYEEGQNTYATAGMVLFAHFKLNNQSFTIMDAGGPQPFSFNEALSFVINCENQTEIDYYWNKLTENGGAESRCGWLKDKFGVSWQVVPTNLSALLGNKDAAKAQRAMNALMQMNKLDMDALMNA
jgi:predicted 3-demethylubiquinone-9 3-methyltransferase (glyoxalase superfamily)